MLESRNHVNYPKLGNPVLILTCQHNGEVKLLEAMETHDMHVIMHIIEFIKTMRNLNPTYLFETLALLAKILQKNWRKHIY
jgi:hypothetical protein